MKSFDLGIYAPSALLLKGADTDVRSNIFIGCKNGQIVAVEKFRPSMKKASKVFYSGEGKLVLPGFVNGHAHLAMTLFRGLEDDVPFHTWLFERILPLEAKFVSKSFVRDGTALAALECIRFGVTTVNEMYFYVDEAAKTLDRYGLRAIVAQPLADFPLPEDKDLGENKFNLIEVLAKKYKGHPRIRVAFGPHAPYSCSDDLLRKVATESNRLNLPVHIHVSETMREVSESKEKYGLSPVERLNRLGILKKNTICAHCVHLSDSDKDLFLSSGASVVYNPDSNMKLASGAAPVADYQRRGIPWAFGTDGAASNNDLSLFGAMDLGTKLQKLTEKNPTALKAREALVAATWGGAKALGLLDSIGSIEVGKQADIIGIKMDYPHLQPSHDVAASLVYSAQGLEVSDVFCAGKRLLKNGQHTAKDVANVYRAANKWRKKIDLAVKKL